MNSMRIWLVLFLLVMNNLSANALTIVCVRPVARGLTAPVYLTAPNDGSGRLFVVERQGLIRINRIGLAITALISYL